MIYFTTAHLKLDGGIMITASHNPKEYNGMKFVRKESRPISSDTGLKELEKAVMEGEFTETAATGKVEKIDILEDYVEHILSYVDVKKLKPFKVVAQQFFSYYSLFERDRKAENCCNGKAFIL